MFFGLINAHIVDKHLRAAGRYRCHIVGIVDVWEIAAYGEVEQQEVGLVEEGVLVAVLAAAYREGLSALSTNISIRVGVHTTVYM